MLAGSAVAAWIVTAAEEASHRGRGAGRDGENKRGDRMHEQQPQIETSRPIGDEMRQTTCYMCACRCGINVHLKSGKVTYIEGNRAHPVNKGVLCAKGASRYQADQCAVAPARTFAAGRAARVRRVRGNFVGRSAGDRGGMDGPFARKRTREACVFHRARPKPEPDQLLGAELWHARIMRPMVGFVR